MPQRAGRIMDFMESGKLPTDSVKFFVLDEAGGSVGCLAHGALAVGCFSLLCCI